MFYLTNVFAISTYVAHFAKYIQKPTQLQNIGIKLQYNFKKTWQFLNYSVIQYLDAYHMIT